MKPLNRTFRFTAPTNPVGIVGVFITLVLLSLQTAFGQTELEKARSAASSGDFTNAAKLYEEAAKKMPKDKQVMIEAGDSYMELDNFGAAVSFYDKAFDIDSKDPVVCRKRGEAYVAAKNFSKGIESIRRAMNYDKNSLESYMALGRAYIAAGNDSLNKAEITIITARDKYKNAPEPYLALGELYYTRQVFELAISQFNEALTRDTSLVEPRVRLGRAYREMARRDDDLTRKNELYNKALNEFLIVSTKSPKNARAWFERGEIYMLANQFEKAGGTFNEYVKLRPEDPRGDIMLSRAAYEGRFYNLAIEPLERILSKTDSLSLEFKPKAQAMIAKSYFAAKNYAKAREAYKVLPESSLDEEGFSFYTESIMQSGGDTSLAIANYKKMLEKNPKDCQTYKVVANILFKQKKYDEAVDYGNKYLTACPDQPKGAIYQIIGYSHYSQKRYDKAAEAFNSLMSIDSTTLVSYQMLISSYSVLKQTSKAAEVARLLLKRKLDEKSPKDGAMAYKILGKEKFDAKDYKSAIEYFEKAIKLVPDDSQNYLFVAYAYQLMNNKDNACKYYKLVLKYDPKNADAPKNMKAIGCG